MTDHDDIYERERAAIAAAAAHETAVAEFDATYGATIKTINERLELYGLGRVTAAYPGYVDAGRVAKVEIECDAAFAAFLAAHTRDPGVLFSDVSQPHPGFVIPLFELASGLPLTPTGHTYTAVVTDRLDTERYGDRSLPFVCNTLSAHGGALRNLSTMFDPPPQPSVLPGLRPA